MVLPPGAWLPGRLRHLPPLPRHLPHAGRLAYLPGRNCFTAARVRRRWNAVSGVDVGAADTTNHSSSEVCVCAYVCVCARLCVCVYVRASAKGRTDQRVSS